MRKFSLVALLGVFVLAGCELPSVNTSTPLSEDLIPTQDELSADSAYTYTRSMDNPGIDATPNLMMMQEGYTTGQTLSYTFSEQDAQDAQSMKNYCDTDEMPLVDKESWTEVARIHLDEIIANNAVDLDIVYTGD